jgi:hypothetical protein
MSGMPPARFTHFSGPIPFAEVISSQSRAASEQTIIHLPRHHPFAFLGQGKNEMSFPAEPVTHPSINELATDFQDHRLPTP